MTRWVCLDVGETLIDETRVWSTWADVLDVPRFTLLATIGGVIARGEDHLRAFDRLGLDDWRAREPEVRRAYGGFAAGDLYPDALPTLAALSAAGYGVAVIGNQPACRHDELEALGVHVDVLAMSDALGTAKPDPGFFREAVELMGSPAASDVAYVGDRVDNDVVPAAAAGLRSVWLRRGPWALLQRDDTAAADLVVESLTQLTRRVDRLWQPR